MSDTCRHLSRTCVMKNVHWFVFRSAFLSKFRQVSPSQIWLWVERPILRRGNTWQELKSTTNISSTLTLIILLFALWSISWGRRWGLLHFEKYPWRYKKVNCLTIGKKYPVAAQLLSVAMQVWITKCRYLKGHISLVFHLSLLNLAQFNKNPRQI